jgi:hypothetical protein
LAAPLLALVSGVICFIELHSLELRLAPLVPGTTSSITHTFNEWRSVRVKLPRSLDGFSLCGQNIAGFFRATSSNRIVPLGASLYEYRVERSLSGLAHAQCLPKFFQRRNRSRDFHRARHIVASLQRLQEVGPCPHPTNLSAQVEILGPERRPNPTTTPPNSNRKSAGSAPFSVSTELVGHHAGLQAADDGLRNQSFD